MNIIEEQLYFTSNNHQLYGMMYEPERVDNSTENYIILHPFAEEKKSSQKVLVNLARCLCNMGNKVFLFDFYGCGDSEGELSGASISMWIEDTLQALKFLREKTQLNIINIIGLRLGAYIGAVCANKNKDIIKLILLEPVINPSKDLSRSLKSKLIKELCTDGNVSSNRKDLFSNLDNDISLDFSGHAISSQFYKDLLNYNETNPYEEVVKNVEETLLINISQMGKPTRQYQKLFSDLANHRSFNSLVYKLEPFWGQIDLPDFTGLIDYIANYCCSRVYQKSQIICRKENVKQETDNQLSLVNNEFTISEKLITINNNRDEIFGVISTPDPKNAIGSTIIFLHGWAGYRIGPHRMIVEYARKLAGIGFHCVRFDFRGKGFSQFKETPDNKTLLSDLECVLNSLKQYGLSKKIILAGICSGAKLAIYYAMKGRTAVDGVILLSTPLLRPDNQVSIELSRGKTLLNEYFKKAFKKDMWNKLASGEIKFRLIFNIIMNPFQNSFKAIFRKKNSYKTSVNSRKNNAFLNFRGKILSIHGEKDPETAIAIKQLVSLAKKYNIPHENRIIDGANHSFYSIVWKNEIFEIIKRWLIKA